MTGSFLATRRGRLTLLLFSAIATARTSALLIARTPRPAALTAGFRQALLVFAIFLLAAVIALRATNTCGEPPAQPGHLPGSRDRMPAAEAAD